MTTLLDDLNRSDMDSILNIPPEIPPEKPPKSKASTAHLKVIPETRELRDRVRYAAREFIQKVDRSRPLSRDDGKQYTDRLLQSLGLGEQYSGFAMVALTNEFYREQVAAIPFHRRLLLLPHCLKNAEGCPADYDEFGLDCKKCGACSVADFKVKAEKLGYKVLVSEGTPIVLKIIVSGHVDAIVGVACLNVLEKAFDKILLAGIPCIATPLLSSNCKSTSVDDDWVFDSIELQKENTLPPTKSYVHLMRVTNQMFEEPHLSQLIPKIRQNLKSPDDPLAKHEAIAFDFLSRGGKHSRPLITLATYDALTTGGKGTLSADGLQLSDAVKRTAMAIETFHKASLVHDDIEDDDRYRYGQETLHRQWGTHTAINVGDYLIGLGYRLVSRDRKELGGDCAADILDKLADAHLKLCEGQGAELLWRDAENQQLTPLDALKIYALKTSPAFEAALYSGVRLAGPVEAYEKAITDFSRNLGVAFQILNDLKDWTGDDHNKLVSGQDILAARPTLLLALALESVNPSERQEILDRIQKSRKLALANRNRSNVGDSGEIDPMAEQMIARVRILFERAKVFTKAQQMIEKYRSRAEAVADEVQPEAFRELLYYLIDTVLEPATLPEESSKTFMVELGMSVGGTAR